MLSSYAKYVYMVDSALGAKLIKNSLLWWNHRTVMHFIVNFAKCALFAQIYLKAPLPFPYSALLHYYGKLLNHRHLPAPKLPKLRQKPRPRQKSWLRKTLGLGQDLCPLLRIQLLLRHRPRPKPSLTATYTATAKDRDRAKATTRVSSTVTAKPSQV